MILLHSPVKGVVEKIHLPSIVGANALSLGSGQETVLAVSIRYCPHHVVVYGLCAECGEAVKEKVVARPTATASLPAHTGTSKRKEVTEFNISGGHRVQLSGAEAKKKSLDSASRLISCKKLVLILDLDHTLLHANNRCPKEALQEHNDIFQIFLTIAGHRERYFIKKRPWLDEFLESVLEKFELSVYTHGTREYAVQVLKHIDPLKIFFGDRVLTRSDKQHSKGNDAKRALVSKDISNLFPVDDSMVLILDDRKDVWKANEANLITIKPYHFFKQVSEELNNASGPSYQPSYTAVDKDKSLSHVFGLLEWIHAKFYGAKEKSKRDVKQALLRLKQRILRNSTVFLHPALVLPFNYVELERLLVIMGASKTSVLGSDQQCSHLVATRERLKELETGLPKNGAAKNQARPAEKEIAVVPVEWVFACAHNWLRESELRFGFVATEEEVADFSNKYITASDGGATDDEIEELASFIES